MIKNAQKIVDASTEINRALWAMNLDQNIIPTMRCSIKNEADRLEYINICCKEAIKELQNYLKESENLLF